MHLTLNYEHFPETIDGLLNFTVSNAIYASDEGVNESHTVYSDMAHAEVGQFVESLFENNCVDINSILIKGETWINEIYFSIYGNDDIY